MIMLMTILSHEKKVTVYSADYLFLLKYRFKSKQLITFLFLTAVY